MSAGQFTIFDLAIPKLHKAIFDLPGQTIKVALCDGSQALTSAFSGTSGDCRYSDLTGEVANGNGYTTGGSTLAGVAATALLGVTKLDADDAVWGALTKTGLVYGVMYDFSSANKDLIGYCELNSGGSVDTSGGAFTIQWNSAGIWTCTRV